MVRKQPNENQPRMPHTLLSNKRTEKVKINDVVLNSSVENKLLGIILDSEKHITGICNKTSQKIYVMSRITSYISLNIAKLLMKMFVESQFNYCTLLSGCFNPDVETIKSTMYAKMH